MIHVLGDIDKEETMNEMNFNDEKFETETNDIEELDEVSEVSEVSESIEETMIGIVNCKKLNIRREPAKQSDNIIQVVNFNTELMVDISKSTSDWYKVYSVEGVEGYCMKDFVTLS